jgi:hypothetical protein
MARRYGVSRSLVGQICAYQVWRDPTPMPHYVAPMNRTERLALGKL